ncbi:hypothetical protein GUITHDRAFT_150427 [Guillardia theta CCMP2712]|uniref:NAD-dependent epimerase/dehydratase domain-containing protein n=1 Tax=Guillardia theta (strain CCMP2712) TaxID=905079 RepID=L1JZH6_GUITC|nr:hypothetical protein GUITHDRAFT_150427 [Guillardia theta CCMP2712]EKX53513.1 hypothetical protein GUITHDRAFT_150427 [Guillardia theta CCMP2712]|eukprot:XP_005840493.1 hypothetical protein GUITHDRAFT_150427 [Guillardia theta CCMP2712]
MSNSKKLFVVTGGTGFVGVELIHHIIGQGHRVRVLVRTPDKTFEALKNVEFAYGSVTDQELVNKSCEGCSGIFHVAGVVDHSRSAAPYVYKVNTDGTRVIMQAAIKNKCKVVFVSTSGTTAVSKDAKRIASDETDYAMDVISNWPYYDSKRQAEELARELSKKHGVPLKSLEYYRHKSIYKFLMKKVPWVPGGGLNFCDVRDLVPAIYKAMVTPEANGRTFLIGAVNMSLAQFFQALEKQTGIAGPKLVVPFSIGWSTISALNAVRRVAGKDPLFDKVVIEMAYHFWYFDAHAAQEILNFKARDWQVTIKDSVQYICEHGHLMGLPHGVPVLPAPRSKL